MCGIFAWSGKDPKNFNKAKFDILGIYNIERGKDSCGVSVDGEIIPGIGTNKLYSSFLTNNFIKPKKNPVVIGHTRQSSLGNSISIENTHPFGFGALKDDKNSFEFIGCHNGTIYNKKELAFLFEVDLTEEKKTVSEHNKNVITTSYRTKIDSEILLECLYKTKNFKVLSKYNGAAAIVFTNLNEPNVIYVFTGASKNYDYASNPISTERPLFYYKETKNSLYISSIDDSLVAIGGIKNKNVFSFSENTLYKITDGDINSAEKTIISRKNCTQKDDTDSKGFVKVNNQKSKSFTMFDDLPNNNDPYSSDDDEIDYLGNYYHNNTPLNRQPKNSNINITLPSLNNGKIKYLNSNNSIFENEKFNIYDELPVRNINDYGSRVYFNKFRFYRTGHLINGIYTFIQNYGYYFLAEDSIEEARRQIKLNEGLIFINGNFIKDTGNTDISEEKYKSFIPFSVGISKNFNNLHYFIQGVKLYSLLDYNALKLRFFDSHIKNNINIDHVILSQASTFPVININIKNKDFDKQGVLVKGLLSKERIKHCYLGSERTYTIDNGNVTNYKDNILCQNVIFGSNNLRKIKTFEDLKSYLNNEDEKKQEENKKLNESNSEVLTSLIDEHLTEVSVDLDELINEINKYAETIDFEVIENKKRKLRSLQDMIETLIN